MEDEELVGFEEEAKQFFREFDKSDELPKFLAHYTDTATARTMLESDSLWLSNPLFMNDTQEYSFGMLMGSEVLFKSDKIRECFLSSELHQMFLEQYKKSRDDDQYNGAIDTYVSCFTAHQDDSENEHGRLSMWRAYGANGDGAAIVFDIAPLMNPSAPTPLLLTKVEYRGQRELEAGLTKLIQDWCKLVSKHRLTAERIRVAATQLFELVKLYSLTHKHIGFSEEREWRLIYSKEIDREGQLEKYFSYANGPRGFEPKLKLDLWEIKFRQLSLPNLSYEHFVRKIILGPCVSSGLAIGSFRRALEVSKKSNYGNMVTGSQIPFRNKFIHRPSG